MFLKFFSHLNFAFEFKVQDLHAALRNLEVKGSKTHPGAARTRIGHRPNLRMCDLFCLRLMTRERRGSNCRASFTSACPSHLATPAAQVSDDTFLFLYNRKTCSTLREHSQTGRSSETKHHSSYRSDKEIRQSSLTRSERKDVHAVLPPAVEDSTHSPTASVLFRASSRAGTRLVFFPHRLPHCRGFQFVAH